MKPSIKIGRDNSNDVAINEPRVSRNHAIITDMLNGSFELKDLGSTNGTFVNGQKVTEYSMKPGDVLQVASSIVDWESAFRSAQQDAPAVEEKPFDRIRKTVGAGSASDNHIIVEGGFVSAHHATISLLKNGSYYLQDNNSSNGSYVNGVKVSAKNFSKTDTVKLANTTLPQDWFLDKNLRYSALKDNRKKIILSSVAILILTASAFSYINRCTWFGIGCELTDDGMYTANKNALVHIQHDYFYTITYKGTKYYVGKNRSFSDHIDANTSLGELLPYNTVTGNGCVVKKDGTILTSPFIVNPWMSEAEQRKMLSQVIDSRTIKGLTLRSAVAVCGETAVLKWIPNGAINNQQNYIEARAPAQCMFTDSSAVTILSVKKGLPSNVTVASFGFGASKEEPLKHSDEKYFSYILPLVNNQPVADTFYSASDTFNINKYPELPVDPSMPAPAEGSAVFNSCGEVIGIIQKNKLVSLRRYAGQLTSKL